MGIFRRSGSYYALWYEDGQRRRQALETKDRREAETRFAEVLSAARKRERLGAAPEEATADEPPLQILEEYLEDMARRQLAASHIGQRRSQLRKLFEEIGAATVRGVTTERIAAALRVISCLSPRAQNDYRAGAHAFFSWLVKAGRLARNPVTAIRPVRELEEPKRRALTVAELERLLQAVPRHRAIVYRVAATCGLRRSEVRALRQEQLDLAGGWVTLRAAGTKAKRSAKVPLVRETIEALRDWIANPVIVEERLIHTVKGPYTKDGEAQRQRTEKPCPGFLPPPPHIETFQRDLEAAGIALVVNGQRLVFHSLRATYITNLWRAGFTAAEVCKFGRLKDVKTALRHYTHLGTSDEELMRVRLEALLGGSKGVGEKLGAVIGAVEEPQNSVKTSKTATRAAPGSPAEGARSKEITGSAGAEAGPAPNEPVSLRCAARKKERRRPGGRVGLSSGLEAPRHLRDARPRSGPPKAP